MSRYDREMSPDHARDSAQILANLRKTLKLINLRDSNNIDQTMVIIKEMEDHLAKTLESTASNIWQVVIISLRIFVEYLKYRDIVKGQHGNILEEKEKIAFLYGELKFYISNLKEYQINNKESTQEILKQDSNSINAETVKELLEFIKTLPLPSTYWKNRNNYCQDLRDNFPDNAIKSLEEDKKQLPSPIVRLIAFIDNAPLVTPQQLEPQLTYSLKFKIKGITWHSDSEELHINLVTTCPQEDYSVSNFVLQKPDNLYSNEYEGEIKGQINFKSAQSLFSEEISFVVGCAFKLSDNTFNEIPVIGHNQIQFRIVERGKWGLFSGYHRLDSHIVNLLHNLLNENPSVRCELTELIQILESLTCLLGTYAQGAVFKKSKSITEAEFQSKVLQDLRFRLGQDVEEHPSQAGGNTDIRYRGVIVELKVEKSNGKREHICEKYTKQPTQYAGAEARQVSVLLVLDLTEKKNPTGDIRNDILLVDVPTHGGEDDTKQYQSKAFVFVVNGNIKSPSDYSK